MLSCVIRIIRQKAGMLGTWYFYPHFQSSVPGGANMMRKMQKGGDGASRITVFTKSNFEGDSKERTFINQRQSICLSQSGGCKWAFLIEAIEIGHSRGEMHILLVEQICCTNKNCISPRLCRISVFTPKLTLKAYSSAQVGFPKKFCVTQM